MASASTSAPAAAAPQDASRQLLIPLHIAFVEALDKKRDSLAYHFTTHLRMNGVYWGLTALEILGKPEVLDRQALIDFVFSCWNDETGGFGSFPGHDAHVHSSLSAIQILAMKDALGELDSRSLRDKLIKCTPLSLLLRHYPGYALSADLFLFWHASQFCLAYNYPTVPFKVINGAKQTHVSSTASFRPSPISVPSHVSIANSPSPTFSHATTPTEASAQAQEQNRTPHRPGSASELSLSSKHWIVSMPIESELG